MNVAAFNCSPRVGGNTETALRIVLSELESRGIETKLWQVGGKVLRGCTACGVCGVRKDGLCAMPDDGMNGYIKAMREADGILLGSPVYYSSMTAEAKAFIDRAGHALGGTGGRPLSRKVGASLAVARKAGANLTFAELNMFFFINDMIVPGSRYWNVATARNMGELELDTEAVGVLKRLGENMAWLITKLNG